MHPLDLEGLIPPEVGQALHDTAAQVPADRAIVEIGSYKGKSTCCLAAGAAGGEGARVWAVDPWDLAGNPTGRFGFAAPETRAAFDRQVKEAGLTDRITAVQAFSVEAAAAWEGPPVGLLYIDGDHSEKAVRDDFRAWAPHLAPDAIVVFDDLDTPKNPGVRRALEALELNFVVAAGRLAFVAT